MEQIDYAVWVRSIEGIAREAGKAILEVYHAQGNFGIETKEDDSPVTRADYAAHKVIAEGLRQITPEIPLLSEEGVLPSFDIRRGWSRYWLVDPLDGTKEFISQNGEFTVNIALIENGVPILGVVYAPVLDVLYCGVSGQGAWLNKNGASKAIRVVPVNQRAPVRVVASRRHGAEALEGMLGRAAQLFPSVTRVNMGSSLKICLIAEGLADWYPRLAPTSEWDTAAAQAILEAAGGLLCDESMQPLRYNTKDSLLNPWFHAMGDVSVDWKRLIAKGA
ncbi:MAG: 3'(2'),5'-bisphosphate nucleotidase CysQ [Hahellaceae bacterium]|nr:3'(2'),5'-bisphosphate nucleotidase CysQ [Hahellaceae bacterium]MCP5169303.1 3'(2'),5'-bisphosphate nucleotidase CysQ [Hahellaceae bacterium]